MLKNIWKDPVWSKVIATGVVALGALCYAYAVSQWPDFSVIDLLANAWTTSRSWATSTSPIPNWLSVVTALLAILAIFIILAVLWSLVRTDKSSQDWRNYSEDEFSGIRWRWRHAYDSIVDINTFCPNCDFQIYPKNASAYIAIDRITFQCDVCNRELGVFDESYDALANRITRLAQQKIRNGTWNNKAASAG